MELRQLETFARVAALGSFTRAAEELSLTQPAVTRQVAALERELRTRLLDRQGRRARLTAAGEALYRYAEEMLRLAEDGRRAVADVQAGVAGRLVVGASSTAATYLLPPALRRFREAYPGVDLTVHTGLSARIADLVAAGDVDAGVVMGDHARPGLAEVQLGEAETVVVVYAGHPLALRRDDVRPEELDGSPLILMEEGTNLRRYVDRLLSAAGVREQVSMELDNVEAIKKMVESRLGISLLPRMALDAEVAAGSLAALPLAGVPAARRPISLLYRKDRYRPAALTAFIAELRAEREPQETSHS